MKKKIDLSLAEKRRLLFFLKINGQNGMLRNHSSISILKKEIAREISGSDKEKKAKKSFN